MSTRARVGIDNQDGTVTSVYVHFDGYPDGVGKTLVAHYTDPEKIADLMRLGDLSTLGREIGEEYDFNTCLAYGRDCKETDVDAMTHQPDAWPDYGQNYEYVFRDGTWLVRGGEMKDWQSVESRCWSVAPDGVTECEREHGHGGRHQRSGLYWESPGARAALGDGEQHG